MSAFDTEISRLKGLLNQGYLQRDPRVTTIRGVTFKPALMGGMSSQAVAAEAQAVANLGLNTVRIDWYAQNPDQYLALMSSLGMKTIFLTPFPVTSPPPAHLWHNDPFDNFTVDDWKAILAPILTKYGNDNRVYAFEIIGEPLIKPEHYAQMNELGQWVQANCTREVFVSLDVPELVQPLLPSGSMLCYHYYRMSLLRANKTIVDVTNELRQWIATWKTYGKPIIIGETGFPTYLRYPSNSGNTPYNIATINTTTPETEELQHDWIANILHVIKDTDIAGYLVYQWTDDLAGGEGGFGMKTTYPTLRAKPTVELLATSLKYVFSQWQDGDINPVKTITV